MFSIAGQTVQCPDGLNMSCNCIISLSIRQWDNVILTLLSTFINDLLANEISDEICKPGKHKKLKVCFLRIK
jgi:hypothetical protein